jgi:hypothetical protein
MNNLYRLLILILFSIFFIYMGCQSEDENTQESSTLGRSNVSGELSYKIPDGWKKETPSGSMRKAQYRLPGVDGLKDAELAVFVFPGGGGAVEANINRWISQFTQPDGSDSMERAEIKQVKSHGLPVTLIYITGTHLKGTMGGPKTELNNYAMVAAIVETSTDPWFFKTIGPQVTIDYWRSEFENFAGTMMQE